jgi:RNA polymerase sigma factor (sigma-70 family)
MATRTLTWFAGLEPRNSNATPGVEDASAPARALASEQGAWDELFRTHNRRVVLTLLARGVRADTARDLAQDAWMRIIEQQRRGRLGELKLPGLVIKQALFLAADRARSGDERHRRVPIDERTGDLVDGERRLIARSHLARVRAILAGCGPRHQQVFRTLYSRSGASAADVAAETGLSVQRVRQIVCEVRKKLRVAIEEDVHD